MTAGQGRGVRRSSWQQADPATVPVGSRSQSADQRNGGRESAQYGNVSAAPARRRVDFAPLQRPRDGDRLHHVNVTGLSSPYSIASSALDAASTRLAVSANNVANARTDGYDAERADASELRGGGVRVSISSEARARAEGAPSSTDLIQENTHQLLARAAFQANLKTLRTAQELDGALMALGSRD